MESNGSWRQTQFSLVVHGCLICLTILVPLYNTDQGIACCYDVYIFLLRIFFSTIVLNLERIFSKLVTRIQDVLLPGSFYRLHTGGRSRKKEKNVPFGRVVVHGKTN